jgi:glycosyltransferase involved in cell wall biosynthesis
VSRPVVVVPCFNEERRLDADAVLSLAAGGAVEILLVDDGSTDGTGTMLRDLQARSPEIDTLFLDRNRGKAEAVRRGLLEAIDTGAIIVGYYDADLSTPPAELQRLVEISEREPGLALVMASRVRLLGREIDRRAHRHYLGRVFATFASLTLSLPVYDTQCGAKVLHVTPALRDALSTPFTSTWVFDVELIGRLLYPANDVEPMPLDAIIEIPLQHWHDVAGSKLGVLDMSRAALDLARVALELRRRPSYRRARTG